MEQKTVVVCLLPNLLLYKFNGRYVGKYLEHQQSTVFLHDAKNHKYWIPDRVRHYTDYRSSTNNKLTSFDVLEW